MSSVKATTPDVKPREWLKLARDAQTIVLTGVVLGIAFNYLGLTSRPPRGLPWIAVTVPLQSVESLVRSAGSPNSAKVPPMPAISGTASPSKAQAAHPTHPFASRTDDSVPGPTAGTGASAESSHAGAAAGRERAAENPALASATGAGLPTIPEAARPFKVGFSTVVKFVDAGAALVVDARERSAFADGHIPGAVNVPYDEAARDPAHLEKLDSNGRPIIVYCGGGTCEASLMLAEMLVRDFDMRRVLVYEGGFPEWVAAGKPVSKVNQ